MITEFSDIGEACGVYAWSWSGAPGLVKIGHTTMGFRRFKIRRQTDVPPSFWARLGNPELLGFVECWNHTWIEPILHSVFADHREPGSEFFRVDPTSVVAALKLLEMELTERHTWTVGQEALPGLEYDPDDVPISLDWDDDDTPITLD